MKKVAIYARTARETQNSINKQIARVREQIKVKRGVLVAEFVDRGVDGNTSRRPALDRLRRNLRAGKISTVYIDDISRIGRNPLIVLHIINEILSMKANIMIGGKNLTKNEGAAVLLMPMNLISAFSH